MSLQFTGVNDGKNPDGSSFNPNDIVSGEILSELYKKHAISNIALSQFVAAFSSSYRTVYMPSTVEEDPDGKSKKKSENEKLDEMIKPSLVTIYMDSQRGTFKEGDFSQEQIRKIMEGIPDLWSKKFKNLHLSRNVPNPFISVDFDQLLTREYGDVYSILESNLKQFITSMDKLGEEFDFSSYKSAKYDMTLEDAYFVVKTGLQRELDGWYFFPKVAGVAKDKEKRITFLKSNISQLTASKEVLVNKNEQMERLLSSLKNPQPHSRVITENLKLASRNDATIETLDSNLLERIFKSGENSASTEYVTAIAEEMLKGVKELAELSMEISNGKSELAALEGKSSQMSIADQEIISNRIKTELTVLLKNYKKWIEICINIARESSDADFNQQKGIYSTTSPVKSKLVNPSASKGPFTKFVVAPGMVLTVIFVGFCSLLIARRGYMDYKKSLTLTMK